MLSRGGEAGGDGRGVPGHRHPRRRRALSGHGLDRLLGYLVRVFGSIDRQAMSQRRIGPRADADAGLLGVFRRSGRARRRWRRRPPREGVVGTRSPAPCGLTARVLARIAPASAMLTDEELRRASRRLLRRHPGAPCRGQDGPHLAAAVSHPAHRVSHDGSRVGDGRQGSHGETARRPDGKTARRQIGETSRERA